MILLTALRCCICDAGPVFAVAPGTEPDGVGDLFRAANADRGQRAVAYCETCWIARFSCLPINQQEMT